MVDSELEQLEAVLSTLEARFIGASILIVYEGDAVRLEDALDRWEAKRARQALLAAENPPPEYAEDDEDEADDDEIEGEDSSTSSDDDEDDGARADARRARRCPPMVLKLIDFAHTGLVEGEGPDQGVLKGVRTLRGLIKDRSETVKTAVYAMGASER
jgi:1D-myo-inositol-tetrakisphosphate 5-kinase/inositol-polyphosphate multikinase